MRVLIADDESLSRRSLEASLRRWGHEVVVANDGLEAASILEQSDAPRLLVLDWLMPGIDGIELCRTIRQRKVEPYTYVLMLTSKHEKCDVVEGLQSGADDFLSKPFDPMELRMRILTGERILDLLNDLVVARESIRDVALHDGLTGLWNRTGILEILDQELDRGYRQGSPLGLILVDLDRFKAINDIYGHLVGDEALRVVAQAIRETIRTYDSAGRYGGEELLVIVPGCDGINAARHAERLRISLSKISLPTSVGELHQTASFGVTVAIPDLKIDKYRLIEVADSALYRAKHQGRNCVEFGVCADIISAEN